MSGKKKIYVRHARVKGNELPLPCLETDTIYELAQAIKDNAELFDLQRDDIKINTICLILKDDEGNSRKLEFSEPISVIKENDRVEFNEEQELRFVFIKYETQVHPMRFQYSEDDRVSDLAEKIKEKIANFDLTDHDAANLKKKGSEIILKTTSEQEDETRLLDTSEKVIDFDSRRLEFFVQTRQMRIIKLDDIKEKCNDLNIAFIGVPGHGKSSTINTIIKALSRLHTPLASTWKGASTGTAALTTYKIDVKGKSFTCIDIPGGTLERYSKEDGTKTSSQVISDIFDGKYPADEPLDYWAWYSPKAWAKNTFRSRAGVAHAVAYVHKGTAEPDRLGNTVIEVVQKKGRGIPVFAIITHIDKMSAEDVDTAVEKLSNTYGIDNRKIFRVANFDHKEKVTKTKDTSEEDFHVLRILFELLSAGKTYKKGGKVTIE